MILYPKISNPKKSHWIIQMMVILSVIISMILLTINLFIGRQKHWAVLAISGIIYIWIVTMVSIKKNTNIALHVMLQTILASILCIIIDFCFGFHEWSINVALPIIVMVANVAIFILTIVSYKKYLKYVIYQLIIFLWSMLPLLLAIIHQRNSVLIVLSTAIALASLFFTLIVSGKDVKEEVQRRFHM